MIKSKRYTDLRFVINNLYDYLEDHIDENDDDGYYDQLTKILNILEKIAFRMNKEDNE